VIASLLRYRSTAIWIVLVVLTVISWLLGTHGADHRLATVVVMAFAFMKIRFVGMYFMELRDAPLPLRGLFEIYCLVVGTGVLVMYLAL
jgi:heme/copper-type cytochrome/quinol oxidase subunit 4